MFKNNCGKTPVSLWVLSLSTSELIHKINNTLLAVPCGVHLCHFVGFQPSEALACVWRISNLMSSDARQSQSSTTKN